MQILPVTPSGIAILFTLFDFDILFGFYFIRLVYYISLGALQSRLYFLNQEISQFVSKIHFSRTSTGQIGPCFLRILIYERRSIFLFCIRKNCENEHRLVC